MSRKYISSVKLLFLTGLSSTLGYTNTGNHPFAHPFGGSYQYSSVLLKQPIVEQETFSYDLGLGKNKPVKGRSRELDYDAAHFMVEHESVRDFPSPLEKVKFPLQAAKTETISRLPKVEPKRQQEEHLKIVRGASVDEADEYPRMIPISNMRLDLNTVWVEMLIHDEKMKLVSV